MITLPIGKLQRVPLREVWKHEAYALTQWLQESIDVLNTALDLNLVSPDANNPQAVLALIWWPRMRVVVR